jgi:hypothetical protein
VLEHATSASDQFLDLFIKVFPNLLGELTVEAAL